MTEFDRVAPWIQAAIDEGGGTHTLEDIRKAIDADQLVLRTNKHTAFLLDVVQYPNFKALRVMGCGGECNKAMEEAREFATHVVPVLAKAAGVHRYQWIGRKGWERALKGLGMTCHVFMFKEV